MLSERIVHYKTHLKEFSFTGTQTLGSHNYQSTYSNCWCYPTPDFVHDPQAVLEYFLRLSLEVGRYCGILGGQPVWENGTVWGPALAVEGGMILAVVMMQDGRQWYPLPNGVKLLTLLVVPHVTTTLKISRRTITSRELSLSILPVLL